MFCQPLSCWQKCLYCTSGSLYIAQHLIYSFLGAASLVLTAEPEATEGLYCPVSVELTCRATEIDTILFWIVNGSAVAASGFSAGPFPVDLAINPPFNGVTVQVDSASMSNVLLNIVSVLSADDVSVFDATTILCTDRINSSAAVIITVRCKSFSHFLVAKLVTYCCIFSCSSYPTIT